jgi:hypothetical protein
MAARLPGRARWCCCCPRDSLHGTALGRHRRSLTGEWTAQQVRNLIMNFGGQACRVKFIADHDRYAALAA